MWTIEIFSFRGAAVLCDVRSPEYIAKELR